MPIQITKTYEYKFVPITIDFGLGGTLDAEAEAMSAQGAEGWELVPLNIGNATYGAAASGGNGTHFFFRRVVHNITVS